MKPEHTFVTEYFKKLGLDEEVCAIYLALHAHGPQTISELARSSGVERTKIYRLSVQLKSSGLIEVEVSEKREILRAAPISNLQLLISKKEQELHSLQNELSTIERLLTHDSLRSPTTRVQFYQGTDGVKQMLWNETKQPNTKLYAILSRNMHEYVDNRFFQRWVQRCNEQRIVSRLIIGESYIESQKLLKPRRISERTQFQARFIPEKTFLIAHSTVIYNDVVAYYNWKNDQTFGIEIYNQDIATAQRQFFKILWNNASPVDDMSGKKL